MKKAIFSLCMVALAGYGMCDDHPPYWTYSLLSGSWMALATTPVVYNPHNHVVNTFHNTSEKIVTYHYYHSDTYRVENCYGSAAGTPSWANLFKPRRQSEAILVEFDQDIVLNPGQHADIQIFYVESYTEQNFCPSPDVYEAQTYWHWNETTQQYESDPPLLMFFDGIETRFFVGQSPKTYSVVKY
ncbi:MAG: hypothetical protein R2688_10300 [Fimbriimonadaceae bacterium]